MAVVTPRKRVQIVDRKNASTIDQEFLGVTSYRDQRVTLGVFQEVAPTSMMSRLSVFDGTFSDEEQVVKVSTGTISQNLVAWDLVDDTEIPSYVTVAPVESQVRPGVDFKVTLGDAYFEYDDSLLAADAETVFFVKDKEAFSDGTAEYTLQWVKDDSSLLLDLAPLLSIGRPLNLHSSMKGEFSADGRGSRTGRRTTLFQNTQIIRSGFNISGSALSDDRLNWIYMAGGGGIDAKGLLPLTQKMLREHIKRVDEALWSGQGNYDVANKKFLNDTGKKYGARPAFMGVRQQMDSTRNIYHYNPKDSIENIREDIKGVIRAAREYFGVPVELLVWTSRGGQDILQRAMASENRDLGIQTQIVLSEKAQQSMGWAVQAGLITKSLETTAGSIRPVIMENMFQRGQEFDRVSVNGVSEPERSFDLYFFPIISNMGDMEDGKANVRIHFKSNNVPGLGTINRALVIGHQKGMTGLGTGFSKLDNGMANTSLWAPDFRVDSPVDGQSSHMLTELAPIITHPDSVFVMKAKVS